MNIIYATYNVNHNSIDIYTYADETNQQLLAENFLSNQ